MKKILIIGLLFICFGVKSQTMDDIIGSNTYTVAEFNSKIGAKIVKWRFKRAGIDKILKYEQKYYFKINKNDSEETFKLCWVEFYCLPKRLRNELKKYSE